VAAGVFAAAFCIILVKFGLLLGLYILLEILSRDMGSCGARIRGACDTGFRLIRKWRWLSRYGAGVFSNWIVRSSIGSHFGTCVGEVTSEGRPANPEPKSIRLDGGKFRK
jgi:hypothetical protein